MSPRFGPTRLALGLLTLALVVGCSDEGAHAQGPADPAMKALDAFILDSPINRKKSGWKTRLQKPPRVEFDQDKTYYWKLKTSEGDMLVRLFHESAPNHSFRCSKIGSSVSVSHRHKSQPKVKPR